MKTEPLRYCRAISGRRENLIRMIPGLLAIAEDPQSNAQTLNWTCQAFREISDIRDMPSDPVAWRRLLADLEML